MGRKSKLTDQQWADIKRRVLEGARPADLAREYGVSRATISERVSRRVEEIKSVANQVVSAELALGALPIAEQVMTISYASGLRAISLSLMRGADLSAKNYHRVTALANAELQRVDDAEPMSETSLAALKNVAALTKLGNDAAQTPINLLAANKDAVKRINGEVEDEEAVEKPRGVLVVPGMMADTAAWAAAAQKASIKTE